MSTKETIIHKDGFGFVPINETTESGERPFQIVRRYRLIKFSDIIMKCINEDNRIVVWLFKRYTMTNKNRASVQLISWGAGIQSIRVPNAQGILGDVLLGFDNIDGIENYLKLNTVVMNCGEYGPPISASLYIFC